MNSAFSSSSSSNGRYRFIKGSQLDPLEIIHPEMDIQESNLVGEVPNTINELLAMQESDSSSAIPEKPDKDNKYTANVKKIFEMMHELDTSASEDHQIATALVRHLENYHDKIVDELQEDVDASHSQIASWAVDADRLMRCRILLESVSIE